MVTELCTLHVAPVYTIQCPGHVAVSDRGVRMGHWSSDIRHKGPGKTNWFLAARQHDLWLTSPGELFFSAFVALSNYTSLCIPPKWLKTRSSKDLSLSTSSYNLFQTIYVCKIIWLFDGQLKLHNHNSKSPSPNPSHPRLKPNPKPKTVQNQKLQLGLGLTPKSHNHL